MAMRLSVDRNPRAFRLTAEKTLLRASRNRGGNSKDHSNASRRLTARLLLSGCSLRAHRTAHSPNLELPSRLPRLFGRLQLDAHLVPPGAKVRRKRAAVRILLEVLQAAAIN
jgi:hypothetical protein